MLAELLMAATMGCSMQSGADFPGAFRDSRTLAVGPFAWLGARGEHVDGEYEGAYRWKQPVLVRPGHTVRLRVGSVARLSFDKHGGWDFSMGERTVVFRSCPAVRSQSNSDGRPVTFWSGGIILKTPNACVPVEIRVDRRPVRRRVLAYGTADC